VFITGFAASFISSCVVGPWVSVAGREIDSPGETRRLEELPI